MSIWNTAWNPGWSLSKGDPRFSEGMTFKTDRDIEFDDGNGFVPKGAIIRLDKRTDIDSYEWGTPMKYKGSEPGWDVSVIFPDFPPDNFKVNLAEKDMVRELFG